jgi:hypothetical protein
MSEILSGSIALATERTPSSGAIHGVGPGLMRGAVGVSHGLVDSAWFSKVKRGASLVEVLLPWFARQSPPPVVNEIAEWGDDPFVNMQQQHGLAATHHRPAQQPTVNANLERVTKHRSQPSWVAGWPKVADDPLVSPAHQPTTHRRPIPKRRSDQRQPELRTAASMRP